MSFLNPSTKAHPLYISVVEIEHNRKEKILEVSCKIFTDDFEKTLRTVNHTYVDLLNPKDKKVMEKMVSDYVLKHLMIEANGKKLTLNFLGYEQIEEGIYSYYQADKIASIEKIIVTDSILYEYQKDQMGIIHITVDGNRKSTRLNNPNDKAVMQF